ncbi:MAG: hypothetical protein HY286_17135 [Planctomycetes bacterium]|nr:hypothetical protein [Planctomycetota bacterium]
MAVFDYDSALAESAVFAEVRAMESSGGSRLAARYRKELENIYTLTAGDARDDAAKKIHREWFAELGFDRIAPSAARDVVLSFHNVSRVFMHGADSPGNESADVHERNDAKTIVISILPGRFMDRAELKQYLRHELLLISDILSPSFGLRAADADASRRAPGSTPIVLVKDRYRLCWKISCDGRLSRMGFKGPIGRDAWKELFDRGFNFLPEDRRERGFDMLWNGPRLTHEILWKFAGEPRSGLAETEGAGSNSSNAYSPGSRCPLCKFPTFEWFPELDTIAESAILAIQSRFPEWTRSHGACRECVERMILIGKAS